MKKKEKTCIEPGCEAKVTSGFLRCPAHKARAARSDAAYNPGIAMTKPKWVSDFLKKGEAR